MRITSSGYVGIATTAPLGMLHVAGALNVTRQTNAFNTASTYTAFVMGDTTGAAANNGGLFAIARKTKSNAPFSALRLGRWLQPDALLRRRKLECSRCDETRIYTAATYSETIDIGVLRAQIDGNGLAIFAASNGSALTLQNSANSKNW